MTEEKDQSNRNRLKRNRFFLLLSLFFFMLGLGGLGLREANTFEPKAMFINRESDIDAQSNEQSMDKNPGKEERPTTVSGQVQAGESFYDLMKGSDVPDGEILIITGAAQKVFSLRKIKTGQPYEITFDQGGGPVGFHYEIDDHRLLVLFRRSDVWSARIDPIDYEIRERVVEGTIQDSLYLSLADACQSTVLAADLADIFAWDIDFALDLRKGDAYSILYQERWRGDRYAGPGRILAARVTNQGEAYNAVYYEDGAGERDYYDSDGRSLQKQFLKSPLRFKYISSYFSRNRLHPVLKIRTAHLGVDYAAPYGTPVRAGADGRVVFVGQNGGMGNMIKIRHNGIYSTAYGHLSRYAAGLKVGKQVRQSEIIGYVGSTGLSTGPHLHYSFYKNGKLINPMQERNPRAKAVLPLDLSQFKESTRHLLDRVRPHDSENTSAPSSSAVDGRM